MQIEPNSGLKNVSSPPKVSPPRERNSEPSDSMDFSEVAALKVMLRAEPETRPEAVAHARELIGQVNWPPPEAIEQLAHLLAIQHTSKFNAPESNS